MALENNYLSIDDCPVNYVFTESKMYSVFTKALEPVGTSFFKKYESSNLKTSKNLDTETEVSNDVSENDEEKKKIYDNSTSRIKNNKNVKVSQNEFVRSVSTTSSLVKNILSENHDLYNLCGLDREANTQEIKKKFIKLSMLYHPDRSDRIDKEELNTELKRRNIDKKLTVRELEQEFALLNDAFTILLNPELKKKYDSSLTFNNYLPSNIDPEKFFDIASQYFEKESIWSAIKPVPKLGGPDTSIEDVKKFYAFWKSFNTTRDFSNAGEFDIETATNKNDKRWMQRQNFKVVGKLLKEEKERLNKFVLMCEQMDPRIYKDNQKKYDIKCQKIIKSMNPKEAAKFLEKEKEAAERREKDKKKSTALQILEAKKKTIALAAGAREKIKSNYKKWVRFENNGIDAKNVDKNLNDWVKKADAETIINLWSSIETEIKNSSEPNRGSGLRIVSLIEQTLGKSLK